MTSRRPRGGAPRSLASWTGGSVFLLLLSVTTLIVLTLLVPTGTAAGGGTGMGGGFDMSAGDSYVRAMTKENFRQLLEDPSEEVSTVVVAFLAPWCGHCKRLIPRLELVGHAFEKHRSVVLAKVDCDAQPELKQAFKIGAFPTVLAFRPGSLTAIAKYQGNWVPGEMVAWVSEISGTRASLRGPAAAAEHILSDAAKAKMRARMQREREDAAEAEGGGEKKRDDGREL